MRGPEPGRGGTVEIDDKDLATHEQRMEDFARRTAKATETLVVYALIWTVAAVITGVLWALIAAKG